jgi:D-sedoheptulose 7-phosphate isomerase
VPASISAELIRSEIQQQLTESAEVKRRLAAKNLDGIQKAAELLLKAVQSDAKILLCGNGGSAADAQHMAAELVARLRYERRAVAALALTTNTSTLSALSNDYDFSQVFVRQIEAFGKKGDILIGISTSGTSENVVKAVKYAKSLGLTTIVLTGSSGGKLAKLADLTIAVPADNVQRVQEAHITIGHIWCDLIEQSLINR